MIDGFRIDVTAEELGRHLDERIRHHRERADWCASRAKRLEHLEPSAEDDEEEDDEEEGELGPWWPGFGDELERRAARHRQRARVLMFLRERLATNEIYRLSVADLRVLEWMPVEERAGTI